MYWIVLVVGAVCALAYVVLKIRRNQLTTADAVFWFLFALALIVVALFPQVVYGLTGLLGMESPANFVFLCVLAIVVYRLLSLSVENARLRTKLTTLVQHVALEEFKESTDGAGSEGERR